MRKDRYVVGYGGAGNVVYGKYSAEVGNKTVPAGEDYAQPMTELQAKRALKFLKSRGGRIFRLVEVK